MQSHKSFSVGGSSEATIMLYLGKRTPCLDLCPSVAWTAAATAGSREDCCCNCRVQVVAHHIGLLLQLPGPGRTAAATAGSRWWPTMPPRGGSVRDCLFSTGDVSPSSKSPTPLGQPKPSKEQEELIAYICLFHLEADIAIPF